MEEKVRRDILAVLDEAVKALKKMDAVLLDALSNRTVHNASIYQDKDSITVAVVMYALAKLLHRSKHEKVKNLDRTLELILSKLEYARRDLKEENFGRFRGEMKKILSLIGKIEKKLKWYIEDVLNKAKVVKASKLYEHGLSIETTAHLLGVSQWDLLSYVGKTKIIDKFPDAVPVEERLAKARKIFGLR